MDCQDLPDHPAAAGLAARRFADALAAQALLAHTARLEATLAPTAGLEALFAVEQALDLAWPAAAPACEMIWATEAAPQTRTPTLALRAFDEAGRLLLAQAYRRGGLKHG
ncbi:MAG: hypothetical protein ABS77_01410 [Phenylobacterium sp. SCN 69-14]|nr:MAG: hypothetical protein ABS77_01410 [Phenylobacterium sp. SCN 69-14]